MFNNQKKMHGGVMNMIDSRDFIREIVKENIKIESSNEPGKVTINMDQDLIIQSIYDSVEVRTKDRGVCITIENNSEEIARIYYNDEHGLLSEQNAKAYADYLSKKINQDLRDILNIEQ